MIKLTCNGKWKAKEIKEKKLPCLWVDCTAVDSCFDDKTKTECPLLKIHVPELTEKQTLKLLKDIGVIS